VPLRLLLSALVALGLAAPAAASAAAQYPDMQTLPPRDMYFAKTTTDAGPNRNVLRFTNTAWNAGEGDLRVYGDIDPDSGTAPAIQRIPNDDGTFSEVNVGSYVIHKEHQHFHYDNWGLYQLWKKSDWDAWNAAGRPANQQPPIVGSKTTSCILDEEFIRDIPGTRWPYRYGGGGCDPTATGKIDTGLSVGWGDTYDHYRYDQWIDLGSSTLPDGDYVLRSVADPENKVYESPGKADPARESVLANEATSPVKVVGGRIIDQQAPTGTVFINETRSTTSSPNVDVYVLGRDDVAEVNAQGAFVDESVKRVRVSNNGTAWAEYPYGGSGSAPGHIDWDLTNAQYGGTTAGGERTVYVQFQDVTGKWSATQTDTIEWTGGTDPDPGSSSLYKTAVLADFPVSYWRFGESTGTNAFDERQKHPGTYTNGVTIGQAGLLNSDLNKSARFTGNAFVNVQNSPQLLFGSNLTLEAWIRPDALPTTGKFMSVLTRPEAYSIQFNGPQLEFTIIQGGQRKRLKAPVGAIVAGEKYHVMATYNGQEQRLYVNGQPVATAALTGPADSGWPQVAIGSWDGNPSGVAEFFRGTIDEPAVYNATLTGLQAKQHYDMGIATSVGVATPTNLTATAASSTSVNLTWDDNSNNETNFVIERATNSTFTNPTEITRPADSESYTDTGLSASTQYWYRVKAVTAAESSGWSGAKSVTTQAPAPTAPAAPTTLAATAASSSQINLTWADASSNETGFVVERSTSSTFTSPVTTNVAANATSLQVTGLSASTQYFFRVKAVNGSLSSAFSNTANATTQAPAPTAPAAPTGLTASAASSSQINLAWTDASSNETGFVVERSTSSTFTSPVATNLAAGTTSLQVTGLSASTQYFFRVKAVNGTLSSAFSNTANATTQAPAPTAPAAPTGLNASAASSSQINLAWTDASSNETGFVVERSTSSTFTSPVATNLAAGTTSLQVTGLSASTQYFFRVKAVNGSLSSAFSNTANATTQATTPPPATSYAATVAADAPVSHWRLGETSGTAAADVFARNAGVFRGGPFLNQAGLINDTNRAARFDGNDDWTEVRDSASLDLTNAITLEAWIKPDAIPAAGGWASVVSKPESYSLQFNGPQLEFTLIQNGNRRRLLAPSGAVVAGRTYHAVATYDGATQRLYLNGTQVASRAQSGSASVTTWPLALGSWNGYAESFRGTIDEVAVYNTTLSAARVSAHYTAGAPVVATASSATKRARIAKNHRPRIVPTAIGPAQRLTKGLKGPGKALSARLKSCTKLSAAARSTAAQQADAQHLSGSRRAKMVARAGTDTRRACAKARASR
jgi:phosphodiesterase/alkaline phosphatase D-like protein